MRSDRVETVLGGQSFKSLLILNFMIDVVDKPRAQLRDRGEGQGKVPSSSMRLVTGSIAKATGPSPGSAMYQLRTRGELRDLTPTSLRSSSEE